MPPPHLTGVAVVGVPLTPDELVAAWRPEARRLRLRIEVAAKLQQRLAARLTVLGPGVATTITGRVVSASRQGTLHDVELVPDDARVAALEWLVAVARGAPVRYLKRAPRFLAAMPVVVYGPGGPAFMTTISVSENGCGVAWSGPVPLPAVGAPIDVRLGAGTQSAAFRSVVCWTAQAGRSTTVGVRFVAGAKRVWSLMLGDLKRAGAPPA
jgi:hypothetical protein